MLLSRRLLTAPAGATLLLLLPLVGLISACSEQAGQQALDAEDVLVVGSAEEPQTLDPQYGLFGQIQQATTPVVFEPLFFRERDARTLYPLLATSHRFLQPDQVEVTLRRGVRFSDGSAFDADDVVFTFERLRNPSGAAIPIKYIADMIARVEVLDAHRVVFHLTSPAPGFIGYLVEAPIISADIGLDATPAQFNALDAAVGTGPYRFARWDRGEKLVYVPNDDYWGNPAAWRRIELAFIPNHAARMAALMAGDVHLTNYVPTTDVPRLLDDASVDVVAAPSNRALYFHLDVAREISPHVFGHDGAVIPNPLRDQRVRQALTLAIDRELIVEKILEGYASPTSQWMAQGYLGHNAALKPLQSDRERARALLIDAGYPQGFRFTLHGTAGLYGPDVKVLQALASMWAKIGLQVTVEALPPGVYWGPWSEREFSVALSSYGFHRHRIAPVVKATVASDGYDNVGGYSNPRVDELLAGLSQAALPRQQEILAEVSQWLYEDVGLLPVYHFRYLFAVRTDRLRYEASENVRDLELLRAVPVARPAMQQASL